MLDALFSLKGKTALVTGASSGLGQRFARVLAGAGADLILGARRLQRLQALAEEIRASGPRALALELDVTQPPSVAKAFARARAELAPPDILVNNAGIGDPRRFLDTDEADWEQMLATNLHGAWRVARTMAAEAIAHDRPASIINIASILGLRQGLDQTSYAVAKAGLVQLSKQMALELARRNIRVNTLAPGYIATDINADFFATDKGQAYVRERIPMGRLGEPEELDGALLLLASQASSFMTGAVIAVDGGHLINPL